MVKKELKLTDAESMKTLINKSLSVPLSKDRISLFFKSLCKQKNEFVSFQIYTLGGKLFFSLWFQQAHYHIKHIIKTGRNVKTNLHLQSVIL